MQSTRRETAGALLLLFLALIPAWAPLTRPGLPAWRAGALPVLQLYAREQGAALDVGSIPDSDFAYAVARGFRVLGLDGVTALKASLILGVILTGLLLFGGLKGRWGNQGGLFAALLVLYSPLFLSALYIEGAIAGVWLAAGMAALLWYVEPMTWHRWLVASLGVLASIFNVFSSAPHPPFAWHRVFESPWFWDASTIDLHAPFAWTPGLILLAFLFMALWRLARDPLPKTHPLWGALIGGVLLILVSWVAGERRMAFWLAAWLPLAVLAAWTLRQFPLLQRLPLWAALLILPLLAAGPALSPDFQTYPIPQQPAGVFGPQQILLIDAHLPSPPAPGQTLTLDAVWQATQPIDFDYNLFIHVTDDAGDLVAQWDGQPLPDRPMTTWQTGEVLSHRYEIPIPADAPTSLHVRLGLYNWQTGERLLLPDGSDAITVPP